MSRTVSVIIPTYNRAERIGRCIASLRSAGLDDLEVIVVDDGGNDNTSEVAAAHGAAYIRQQNAGPAAARNNGFRASRGAYVTFIDDDDEWLPNGGARRLVEQLEAAPDIDVAYGDAEMGNPEDGYVSFVGTYGGRAFEALPATTTPLGLRVFERQPFFLQLSTRNVMFLGSMLIRRSCFEKVGGFDVALRGAADWDLFMRMTAAGRVAFSPGPAVSRYYKHDEGMSTNSDHMEEDFIRALDAVRRRSVLDATERQHVDARLRDHVFGWAWQAYERGQYRIMRQRLQWSRQLKVFEAREAAYLAVSYLPPSLVTKMRLLRSRR